MFLFQGDEAYVWYFSIFWTFFCPSLIVLIAVIDGTVKIYAKHERAVVVILGRSEKVKGAGLVLLFPFIQQMVSVDHHHERAIIQVQFFQPATKMLAQTTLPAMLGQHELDEMLAERLKLNADGDRAEAIE